MLVRLSTLAFAASILSTPSLCLSPSDIPPDIPVSQLLASAQSHLSKGETGDALVYYDAAVARDPTNYLTFFKRATTYLSLGRTSQATDDFEKVLSLQPGFEGAHVQLGKLKARFGEWDAANEHFKKAKKTDEMASLEEAKGAAKLAEAAAKSENWEECVKQADDAILTANRALSLRELRARCAFERGAMERGIGDLQHVLQMKPGDTAPHVKISAIQFYALGELQEGMASIRKCLHSDPESKECKRLLKVERMVEKVVQKVTKALEKQQHMTAVRQLVPSTDGEGLIKEVKDQVHLLREDGTIPKAAGNVLITRLVEMACQAYYESNSKKAKDYCEESLQFDENSFYGLLYRAKHLMDAEEFEAAMSTLRKASEAHPGKDETIQPLMQKAQIAHKRSTTKDYYKVLGVAHDADERQIKAAYRKLSKLHHPDKAAKQGLTKEAAEKKMAAINEAYEVLSNSELRARFDRGDDPNSHEQQGFQGNPFGGQPFMFQQGGGPMHFKFSGGHGFPFGR
ncbi:TPR-like protein [Parathielavia appendiculata]|uniref:Tetratricopeptide repeat and J domain-containing co-chaperone DNJ1 n=1 Tax=Parathielavia appendiculata TaxID=2587402 RepID=A0AAN6Z416_9PEZI|nr:TPR-like protein [Parathielavia appendiculata]